MKLPPFDYACPATIPEAVQLLASHDDAKVLAGGQSLVPMLAFRLAHPSLLVDLRKLAELRQIRISERGVALGAMVRWRDIEDDARLAAAHPLLKAAIAHVAHYQIRNRGTVGGSIAHADPAAEMPGHRDHLRRRDRGGRQGRRAGDPGGRFLPGPADDRAHARRDHHRGAAAGLAGAPALGLPGIRPAARRFRHGGGGGVLRPRRARQGPQRPCRRHRRRRPAAAARRRRSCPERAIRRRGHDRQGRGRRVRRRRSARRHPRQRRLSEGAGRHHGRACAQERGCASWVCPCRCDSKSTESKSRSRSSRG